MTRKLPPETLRDLAEQIIGRRILKSEWTDEMKEKWRTWLLIRPHRHTIAPPAMEKSPERAASIARCAVFISIVNDAISEYNVAGGDAASAVGFLLDAAATIVHQAYQPGVVRESMVVNTLVEYAKLLRKKDDRDDK